MLNVLRSLSCTIDSFLLSSYSLKVKLPLKLKGHSNRRGGVQENVVYVNQTRAQSVASGVTKLLFSHGSVCFHHLSNSFRKVCKMGNTSN